MCLLRSLLPEGTTYTLNETTVPVEAAGVGLLFDGIIDDVEGGYNRTGALIDKVDATMGGDSSNRQYQAQYLDLVDANNGNAGKSFRRCDDHLGLS